MSGSMKKLLSHADLIAAVAVVMVVVMMIVPLPTGLIDLFITLNIASAITIVVATLYVPRALDFAAFPSLLLLTTMFRLAINVSVTRQILLHGEGGSVVKAFGTFVVGGNVVVGLVVFLILIVIQFVVVTNGAGRVAEVAARFTLDAMPGKQMAIDADLNAGQINDQQAHQRRDDVGREADFYGAMDGASKFVKGDAVAGILIVSINLIGGIVVGVMQQGLSFPEAAQHYSLLTVGDGLAAQIPALLISVAAGILVTRSASQKDLGNDIAGADLRPAQGADGRAGVICAFALVPGLPKIPFLLDRRRPRRGRLRAQRRDAASRAPKSSPAAASPSSAPAACRSCPPRAAPADPATAVDPLELAIGFGLVPLVEAGQGGGLMGRVGAMRKQLAGELGTVIPAVRIHDELGLDSHEYVLRVRGSEVARGRIMPGHQLAMDSGEAAGQLPGVPTTEPAFGLPATWVAGRRAGRGRGARLHRRRPRIGRRHAPDRDDPRPRRRAPHPPGDAQAARRAERDQRRRGRGGRPRPALARRGPAGAAGAAPRGRADPRPRRDHRGDRRQVAPHPRPGGARRVRPGGARADDHGAAPRRRDAPADDLARPGDRAGDRRIDRPDARRRAARDGAQRGPRR